MNTDDLDAAGLRYDERRQMYVHKPLSQLGGEIADLRARIAELEAACERVARRTVDDWARTELERALAPEKPSSHE